MALTDKQKIALFEYCVDYNLRDAGVRAGYSPKSAAISMNKLMKTKEAIEFLRKIEEKTAKDFEIQRYDILYNLWACATRDGRKFVNDRGELISPQEIKDLPDELGLAIDSIKQKVVRRWTEEDGTEVDILETELKLVPKAAALDMAMRHKGLFAQDNGGGIVVTFPDLSKLFSDGSHVIDANPVEQRLATEQQKLLPKPNNEGNGNGKK